MNEQWPDEAKRYIEHLLARLAQAESRARTWEARCLAARRRTQREADLSATRKETIDALSAELGKLRRKKGKHRE